jgi:hypothetical protein
MTHAAKKALLIKNGTSSTKKVKAEKVAEPKTDTESKKKTAAKPRAAKTKK